jgi:hypothetical protein
VPKYLKCHDLGHVGIARRKVVESAMQLSTRSLTVNQKNKSAFHIAEVNLN